MVYAITVLSFGADGYDPDMADWGYDMPACYQFELNTTIANNTVVAKSKKGVIGIGGQIYNMTVEGNLLHFVCNSMLLVLKMTITS